MARRARRQPSGADDPPAHAQAGELEFHQRNRWRTTPAFAEQSAKLFEHFGFAANDYVGRTVIDLGAGSKLRTKFFDQAEIIVIEPLADRYIATVEWSDLEDAAQVHSVPAEQLVPGGYEVRAWATGALDTAVGRLDTTTFTVAG